MFPELDLWDDRESRAPALQMALDEAIFLTTERPLLRVYRWGAPAVTFGYAQRHLEAYSRAGALPCVRRWTGGGVVFHGNDVTLALAIPCGHFRRPAEVYPFLHGLLLEAVVEAMPGARLAGEDDCRKGVACFASPVPGDIMVEGRKVCGGALRSGSRGMLYQGSLHAELSADAIARSLSREVRPVGAMEDTLALARELERERYGTVAWNSRR